MYVILLPEVFYISWVFSLTESLNFSETGSEKKICLDLFFGTCSIKLAQKADCGSVGSANVCVFESVSG